TKFVIVNSGAAGFLNPPGHAEHNYSVRELSRNNKEISSESLSSALINDSIPEDIKNRAKMLLERFPGDFTEEWEHSVYNYFRCAYSPDGVNRNVNDCFFQKDGNPEHHLGYLFIKSFYPDYEPNLYLIEFNGDKGSWSKKQETE
ncbi:hypothetical protein MKY96_32435, partial [Paenibacillus sp. FSL R7-0302]|uniref:hypothetical protein n=1 Tax=Paenibacillus sp. FSL R7-0302 TaxID=2921681 RepID=UPI0030FBC3DA